MSLANLSLSVSVSLTCTHTCTHTHTHTHKCTHTLPVSLNAHREQGSLSMHRSLGVVS